MTYGRKVTVGRLSFHFSSLNLLLWVLGIAFILQVALGRGLEFEGGGLLGFGSVSYSATWAAGADGPSAVFQRGEWWRLLSCVFLHGGVLHLLMNALAFFNLGRLADQIYGPWRLLLVFLVTGLVASLCSVAWMRIGGRGRIGVGASGAVCGLLGLLLANMRRRTDAVGEHYGRQLLQWSIIMLAFGLFVPVVDNAAHVGGFVAGYLMARFLKEGHFDHLHRGKEARVVAWSTAALSAITLAALLVAGLGAQARHADIEDGQTLVSQLKDVMRRQQMGKTPRVTALRAIEDSPRAVELRDRALEAVAASDPAEVQAVFYETWRWMYELAPDLFNPPPDR